MTFYNEPMSNVNIQTKESYKTFQCLMASVTVFLSFSISKMFAIPNVHELDLILEKLSRSRSK